MERDDRTEAEIKGTDVVYAKPVMRVIQIPGFDWLCVVCGKGVRIEHPEAVQILSKGGKIPVKECGNPDCEGPGETYHVQKQLLVQANAGPNRAMRRSMAVQSKAKGNGNLNKGG